MWTARLAPRRQRQASHGCCCCIAGIRLAGMLRLARHATQGGGGTLCPAGHTLLGGATSTKRADRSDYAPTHRKNLIALTLGPADKPSSCLKTSGQTVRLRRHATAALVLAPRVARWWLHGWHASPRPHGGSGRLFMAVATPRLTRLAMMPCLARHATPGGGGTPCPAAHASHGGGATSTKRADPSDYDPTLTYS